jgi:hypothetical protein
VRCGYHGLLFDGQGRCTEIPGLERVPPHVRVRSYPVVVKNRWVFVWMGDAERADPALLPDNFSNDHPDWIHLPGYLHYDTPYLLICDNLLDFSHLSYVHEKTLGGSTKIAQARAQIDKLPQGIRVTRHVPDVPPPAYYRRMREFTTNLDRWFIYDFLLPGTLLMHSGGRPTGSGAGSGTGTGPAADPTQPIADSVNLHSCQTLTPPHARNRAQHALLLPAVLPRRPGRRGDGADHLRLASGGLQRGPRHDHRAGTQPGCEARRAHGPAGDGRGTDPVPPPGGRAPRGRTAGLRRRPSAPSFFEDLLRPTRIEAASLVRQEFARVIFERIGCASCAPRRSRRGRSGAAVRFAKSNFASH